MLELRDYASMRTYDKVLPPNDLVELRNSNIQEIFSDDKVIKEVNILTLILLINCFALKD